MTSLTTSNQTLRLPQPRPRRDLVRRRQTQGPAQKCNYEGWIM